ncbi:hypothetical protein KVT40_002770 [Elsinoe batatas]|uniref:Uncharacterized protein n=1 Tax=Elsinoe batatas TaxID=2601811 RepID=A0A8K0PE72_9PEZI|nr:hypothetical protein KVT40_002770 [Elsinoe batatas]
MRFTSSLLFLSAAVPAVLGAALPEANKAVTTAAPEKSAEPTHHKGKDDKKKHHKSKHGKHHATEVSVTKSAHDSKATHSKREADAEAAEALEAAKKHHGKKGKKHHARESEPEEAAMRKHKHKKGKKHHAREAEAEAEADAEAEPEEAAHHKKHKKGKKHHAREAEAEPEEAAHKKHKKGKKHHSKKVHARAASATTAAASKATGKPSDKPTGSMTKAAPKPTTTGTTVHHNTTIPHHNTTSAHVKFHLEAIGGRFNHSLLQHSVMGEGFNLSSPIGSYTYNATNKYIYYGNSFLAVDPQGIFPHLVTRNATTFAKTDERLTCDIDSKTYDVECSSLNGARSVFTVADGGSGKYYLTLSAKGAVGPIKIKAVKAKEPTKKTTKKGGMKPTPKPQSVKPTASAKPEKSAKPVVSSKPTGKPEKSGKGGASKTSGGKAAPTKA